jgi:hypothetical protein
MDRALAVSLGGVDTHLHFAMDIDLLLRLSMLKPPLYVHESVVKYRFHPQTKTHGVWSRARRYEKLQIVENLFRMPQAAAWTSRRAEALATAHRYAADCAWMTGDWRAFLYHLAMDVSCSPRAGWAKRRALFHFISERRKNQRRMSATAAPDAGARP